MPERRQWKWRSCTEQCSAGFGDPFLRGVLPRRKGRIQAVPSDKTPDRRRTAHGTHGDLRQELKEGNRSIFSRKLQELMTDRLSRGQQTILFLNRRGYAGFVSCRACGEVMKCPHCDVSLSEHKGEADLPLLRLYTTLAKAMPEVRIQIYSGIQSRYPAD